MFDFPIVYLNSNDGSGLLAFGEGPTLKLNQPSLQQIDEFVRENTGKFIFGYLGYDVKNAVEQLKSENEDYKGFPDVFLWVPDCVVKMYGENFKFLQTSGKSEQFKFLNYFIEEETDQNFHPYNLDFKPITSKKDYLKNVSKLKEHIQKGDLYEVNYCQEFVAENVQLDFELDAYFKLNKITKAPFSSFFKFDEFSIYCGSPERYIRKMGTELMSQPIKGTAPRGKNEEEDQELMKQLKASPKEQAENVMIVDLVRNDLSRIAKKGSVQVAELMETSSFETVHQLVSTIQCEVSESTAFSEIIKATFPMGSMTGAPKVKAMELIEQYEDFKRGVFSGSLGYITPNGDFDFNVLIRSLFYNRKTQRMTCSVGGAITHASDPEKEYEECQTKIGRILSGMNE